MLKFMDNLEFYPLYNKFIPKIHLKQVNILKYILFKLYLYLKKSKILDYLAYFLINFYLKNIFYVNLIEIMTLSFELRNEIANMYNYYYDNFFEGKYQSKSARNFEKKILQIQYDKQMPNLNKKQLDQVGSYYLDNFDCDDLDTREQRQLNLLKPYLKKRGIER